MSMTMEGMPVHGDLVLELLRQSLNEVDCVNDSQKVEERINGLYNLWLVHCHCLTNSDAIECKAIIGRMKNISERSKLYDLASVINERALPSAQPVSLQHYILNGSSPLEGYIDEHANLHQDGNWEYKQTIPYTDGARSFIFQMKPERFEVEMKFFNRCIDPTYNCPGIVEDRNKPYREQIPALELSYSDILMFVNKIGKVNFNVLGYHYSIQNNNEFTITLPDKKTLEKGWFLLQSINPELQSLDLHIIDGNGVESDYDFSKAYLTGIVLSNEREFIHDHLHILSRIARCMESPENEKRMDLMMKRVIEQGLKFIDSLKEQNTLTQTADMEQKIREIEFILGSFVDSVSAMYTFGWPHFPDEKSMIEAVKWKLRDALGSTDLGDINDLLQAVDISEYTKNILTFEKFLKFDFGKEIVKYVKGQTNWGKSWEKRFNSEFTDEKCEEICAFIEQNLNSNNNNI